MEDLEKKLGSILSDPGMMEKIQTMAQNLGAQQVTENTSPVSAAPAGDFDMPDLNMIRKLSSLLGKSQIDPNQKSLLRALSPYVSAQRITRLERAMRAAKMAGMASALLKAGK